MLRIFKSMAIKFQDNFLVITIILILFLSDITHSYSQKFAYGIKAGGMLSTFRFGDKDDKQQFTSALKPGFLGICFLNFPLKKNFSLQTEAGFSQRGRKIKFNEDTWINSATYHFIDGAIMLRKSYPLQWAKNARSSWFINIGPKVSYWLNGKGTVSPTGPIYNYKVKFEKAPTNSNSDYDIMYLTNLNRWLLSLDIGIGISAPTTLLQRFAFEIRFNSGQTFYGNKDSAFNRTPGFTDNLRAREKVISFSIDYIFNKAKKGMSTQKDVKGANKSKPRKNIDSMIH
jgi:hypothetical protein